MTREEALREMETLVAECDYEAAHLDADVILMELLRSLGYDDVVEAYEKVGKWYS